MAPNKTYKFVDLVGISEKSFADAANNAVKKASETLQGLAWFEVTEERGSIENGKIKEYQVSLRVAFKLMGDDELQARPYFLVGLGVTRFSRSNFTGLDGLPRAFQSKTRFSPTMGAGVKYYLRSHKYGLNLGVRWTPTFLKDDTEGFWCSPYWGCFTEGNSQFVHQIELAGGIQLRF